MIKYLKLQRNILLTGAKIIFITQNCFAEPAITIIPDPIKIKLSGVVAPMILQRSVNCVEWEDLFIVTPEFNEKRLPDSSAEEHRAFFYRLKSISEPLKLQMNMSFSSSHLASIVSGSTIEIKFFGDRDSEGYPLNVQRISYMIGNRIYNTEPLEASASTKDKKSPDDTEIIDYEERSAVPIEYFSGNILHYHLFVPASEISAPVVQYRNIQVVSDTISREISGQVEAVFDPDASVEYFSIFRYTVPYHYSYPCVGPTDTQRAYRGFEKGLENIFDPLNVAQELFIPAAVAGGATLPVSVSVSLFAIGTVSLYVAVHEGIFDESPYKCDPIQPFIANTTELTAIAQPYGSSSMVTEIEPAHNKEGQPLFLYGGGDPGDVTGP